MKICFANDTHYHAGSKAVTQSILGRLISQGHTISRICHKYDVPTIEDLEQFDALIINGEGTFRDEVFGVDAIRQKALREAMLGAKVLGLYVCLINAVWCRMKDRWGVLLSRLDQVAVREIASANEMYKLQGIMPDIYPDAAYYAPLTNERGKSLKDEIVVGTVYPHPFPLFNGRPVTEKLPIFESYPKLTIPIGSDLSRWSYVVNTLRDVKLYITGQHHGVYAACKARTPFVSLRLSNHKISGLFEWAKVSIPIVESLDELPGAIDWALKNLDIYNELFDFIESREPWPGIKS